MWYQLLSPSCCLQPPSGPLGKVPAGRDAEGSSTFPASKWKPPTTEKYSMPPLSTFKGTRKMANHEILFLATNHAFLSDFCKRFPLLCRTAAPFCCCQNCVVYPQKLHKSFYPKSWKNIFECFKKCGGRKSHQQLWRRKRPSSKQVLPQICSYFLLSPACFSNVRSSFWCNWSLLVQDLQLQL